MIEFVFPNAHAAGVLLMIVVALVLFSRERIPLETTSLLVLVALTLGFTLFPFEQAGRRLEASDLLLGFGNRALVAVCSLMILGHGLVRTGALEPVGRLLAASWRRVPSASLLLTLLMTAFLSAFINDTPIVVLMLPILIGVSVRTGVPPSRTLMPMCFASILGGMSTTIGTSTNLLVVNVAADMGMDRFDMFDFLGPAAIAIAVAFGYLWLIAPRLLPDIEAPMREPRARLYTAQLRLADDSPLIDEPLAAAIERTRGGMRVDHIQRGDAFNIAPLPDVQLRPGDRLTTVATPDDLREWARALGAELWSGDHEVDAKHPLKAEGERLAEVAIPPASPLIGRRIGEAGLKDRFGLRLLAFTRLDETREREAPGLEHVRLTGGDVLLVQADTEQLEQLKHGADFLVLDGGMHLPRTRKAPLAILTMIAAVLLSAFKIVPIEISALAGCLLLIAMGCLTWKEALNALSGRVILIIVASLALGTALMQTGGANWLAQVFVSITFGAPPWAMLAGLMALIAALTNVVSNNAAAVIGTPVAIGIAQQLGLPLEPFVLAVLFGANLCFATPMAYQTNILVMGAAGYQFRDFVRVGLPLAIIVWITLTVVLSMAYGL